MSVTVVIPTYNSGPLVVEAVASVLAQTRPADEIVVVDDGSTDDTAERIARFGPPVRLIRKANGGVSSARNHGVTAATGDLIAFLDADDVWHPRKLELQLAELAARPELGALGTRTYGWPAAHPELTGGGASVEVVPLDRLIIRNAFVASTVVLPASVLREIGPFDEDQFGTEDYDLWLRVARVAPVANLTLPLVGYRTATPASLSKNAVRMEAGMRIILGKLEAAGVFRGRPLLRQKAWGYFRYSCGYMHQAAGSRWTAVKHAMMSLTGYPLPYESQDVRYSFGRVRLLAAALLAAARKPGRVPTPVSSHK